MFGKDRHTVNSCYIGHFRPLLSLLTIKVRKRPKATQWYLNSGILNKHRIEQFAKEIQQLPNDNGEVSLTVLWDTFTAVMTAKLTFITSWLKKLREEKMVTFQKELKELALHHQNIFIPTIETEMIGKKNETNEIYAQEIQKQKIFIKQKYYKGGSKHAW